MPWIVYSSAAPYAGSTARLVVSVEPTSAKAVAAAAAVDDWTADTAASADGVGVGDWRTGPGAWATDAPDSDGHRRKEIVSAACAWADEHLALVGTAMFVRDGSGDDAAAKRRWREWRLRALSAAACIQAAAIAAWTPAVLAALHRAQQGLMPLDASAARSWVRRHSSSAAVPPAAGTWTAAFAVSAGRVTAAFEPASTAKADDVWFPSTDLLTPRPWAAATGSRLPVTFDPAADPMDFLAV